MSQGESELREKLLELEKMTPTLRQSYESKVQAMIEGKMTVRWKVAWAASGALGLGFVTVFGYAALTAPREFPVLGRVIFALGAFFGLAWTAFCGLILKRGRFNRRRDARAAAGMAWCVAVVTTSICLVWSAQLPDEITGVRMIAACLVFLVMAAVFMIQARIQTAELNTREKLLEIELRLAELSEKVDRAR